MFVRGFYIKDIAAIAGPIVLGNLGFILIGVGDVIVAGRYSTDALAAVSLATAIINCIMILGIGVISSISAILSNYRGAGKEAEKYFYPSLKFAAVMSVIMSVLIAAFIPLIDKFGFEAKLVPLIKDYFWITVFSTFGAYLHCMAKEFLQAFEIVVFPNILTVLCIFVNLGLNIILAFGYFGCPEMGVAGLALASLITRYIMGIVLFFYCFKKVKITGIQTDDMDCRGSGEPRNDGTSEAIQAVSLQNKEQLFRQQSNSSFCKNYYKDLLKVGLPSSLAVVIEFIGFNAITVILGRISGIYAAAQNIVCTITSVSFMVPFAISNATAVKVGFANGAKYFKSLKIYACTGIAMCVAFMTLSAVIVGMFPEFIVSLFTKDKALVDTCIPVVFSLCMFQVFDGLQVALAGIFKGIKQTKVVMIANFVAYWLVSIPLGCLLALHFKLNLLGFWYSLIVSAIVLCSIMLTTLIVKLRTEFKITPLDKLI